MRTTFKWIVPILIMMTAFSGESKTEKGPDALDTTKGATFKGRIVYFEEISKSLVVKDSCNNEMEFFMEKKILLIQNGKECQLKQFNTKTDVLVFFKKKRTRNYALRIEQKQTLTE